MAFILEMEYLQLKNFTSFLDSVIFLKPEDNFKFVLFTIYPGDCITISYTIKDSNENYITCSFLSKYYLNEENFINTKLPNNPISFFAEDDELVKFKALIKAQINIISNDNFILKSFSNHEEKKSYLKLYYSESKNFTMIYLNIFILRNVVEIQDPKSKYLGRFKPFNLSYFIGLANWKRIISDKDNAYMRIKFSIDDDNIILYFMLSNSSEDENDCETFFTLNYKDNEFKGSNILKNCQFFTPFKKILKIFEFNEKIGNYNKEIRRGFKIYR